MVPNDLNAPVLDESRVRSLARLARLDLPDDEIQRLADDLTKILGHVKQLEELDLDGVDPTAHIGFEQATLRADTPVPSLPVDLALQQAPRVSMDGFAVPAFVDEG